jgi:hypothetical protein
MRNLFLALLLAIVFAGCTKESFDSEIPVQPPIEGLTLDDSPPPLREEEVKVVRVGRELIEISLDYDEDSQGFTVFFTRSNGEAASAHYSKVQDLWVLDWIDSVPCWCVPECSSYNPTLCNWWKCVQEAMDENGGNYALALTSAVSPWAGATFFGVIGVWCGAVVVK